MDYILENEYLKVTVTTWGAQVKSVVRKSDGVEHMWQADKSLWGYHAPILFPYTGRLVDGTLIARGQTAHGAGQHGFARGMEHRKRYQFENLLVLELRETEETLALWPYRFRLLSLFSLEDDTLNHTLTVINDDDCRFSFGIGYHPAFAIPFDDRHAAADYELRFSQSESPLCLGTAPKGLVNGKCYYLGSNIRSIPIDEKLFANDSHCMVNLQSQTLGIYEKDTGRAVVCSIRDFPYTLIWSKPGEPRFVCIEPWNSLPSPENGSADWDKKPAAATLEPAQRWSTTLRTRFAR